MIVLYFLLIIALLRCTESVAISLLYNASGEIYQSRTNLMQNMSQSILHLTGAFDEQTWNNLRIRDLQTTKAAPKPCDLASFETWKSLKYTGSLANDPNFWRYQTQVTFVLTKGLALDLATAKCTDTLKILTDFKSGRTGPVDVQHVYKAMCNKYCLQSDLMHEDALTYTGCTCRELSIQPPQDPPTAADRSSSYRIPDEWCTQNSARLLCDILGLCGVWNCRVDDFMCPRYEWNKKYIPLKGKGNCLRKIAASEGAHSSSGGVLAAVLTIAMAGVLMLW